MTSLDHALDNAARGFAVFPVHTAPKGVCTCSEGARCTSPAKHPIFHAWYEEATTDPETICQWWHRMPRANIGIACGRSRLVVLDCDPRHCGDESLYQLQQDHAPMP